MNKADDITPKSNREIIISQDATLKIMAVTLKSMHDRMNTHMELINTLERKIRLMKNTTDDWEADANWME